MTVPKYMPPDLSAEVSREAVILYAYALSFCDDAGRCRSAHEAGAWGGLSAHETRQALAELVAKGFAEEIVEIVPIAQIGSFVVPGSVVGLQLVHFTLPTEFQRLSAEAWGALRRQVFERDDYTCQYCDERGGTLECDHVEPISLGGTNELGNLVTACSACNKSKRSKRIEEWRLKHASS